MGQEADDEHGEKRRESQPANENQQPDGQAGGAGDRPRTDAPGRRRKLRKVMVGALGTILLGAVAQSLSGAFTTGARTVWSWVASGEPLAVHSQIALGPCGSSWVIPQGRQAPSMPDSQSHPGEDLLAWARKVGAVQANRTTVELTVRGGPGGGAVVLQQLRVRVLERHQPLQGDQESTGCGPVIIPRVYEADLDTARPVAVARVQPSQENPPVSFPYKVTHADPEVVRVTAATERCDCRWVLELVYVDGDQRRVMRIDNHGKPFRTTAARSNNSSGTTVNRR